MTLEKELPREHGPSSDPEAPIESPGVKFPSSPSRCPFCHVGVDRATQEWAACEACLARHHATCFRENGTCASCGHAKSLSPSSGRARGKKSTALVAFIVAVPLVIGGIAAGTDHARRNSDAAARQEFDLLESARFEEREALTCSGFLQNNPEWDSKRFEAARHFLEAAQLYEKAGRADNGRILRDAARAIAAKGRLSDVLAGDAQKTPSPGASPTNGR